MPSYFDRKLDGMFIVEWLLDHRIVVFAGGLCEDDLGLAMEAALLLLKHYGPFSDQFVVCGHTALGVLKSIRGVEERALDRIHFTASRIGHYEGITRSHRN